MTISQTADAGRARRAGAATRAEIISLATVFFANSSYHAASLRELASRAGIRAASIYYHFSSKEELLSSIIMDTVDHLLHRLDMLSTEEAEPRARIRLIVTVHLRQCMERPEETRIILEQSHFLSADKLDQVRAKQRAVLEFYRDQIALCFPSDTPPPLPPAVLALNALAVINAFPRWARPNRSLDTEELIRKTTGFILAAIFRHGEFATEAATHAG